jgi:hypothetical protein
MALPAIEATIEATFVILMQYIHAGIEAMYMQYIHAAIEATYMQYIHAAIEATLCSIEATLFAYKLNY